MKSPFPGMDPYIEACGLWADFHDDLIAEIKRSLAARLPERYFVQTSAIRCPRSPYRWLARTLTSHLPCSR